MNREIKTNYSGVDISYEERTDHWAFTLRGRERRASTLSLAKVAIDAPPPPGKKPFKRCKAIFKEWSRGVGVVEITSVADYTRVWIMNGTSRQKVSIDDLMAYTPENLKRLQVWADLDKQQNAIGVLKTAEILAMEKFELPKDIEQ